MLGDPAAGGQEPSQIELGQAAIASEESVSNDKQAQNEKLQLLQAHISPAVKTLLRVAQS
jgi:hypothetical protein